VPADEPSHWSPLTLTLTAVVVVLACLVLGRWQLTRVSRPIDDYSAEPAAVALDRLVPAGTAVGDAVTARQVTATGHYDAAGQRTVPGPDLSGQPVDWVITPLVTPSGATVAVVRGWVTTAGQKLAIPPTGSVTVTARLERGTLPSGPPTTWMTSGYLVRTAQSPPDPLSLQPVPATPPAGHAADAFHLQNAIYVVQWWLLALIVGGAWWRLMRAGRTRVGGRLEAAARHG
jgi:cytochrome oxidase assembly protein ShyY1